MMSSITLISVILCGIAFCEGIDVNNSSEIDSDPDLEAYLREAIENLKEQMKKGIPAINMPVLDPFQIDNLHLDMQQNMTTINLIVKELTVKHLSRFELLDLKPNLEELYLQISLKLPDLYTSGNYNLSGLIYRIFPIYGQGQFHINTTEIMISGRGKLNVMENNTLEMSLLHLDLEWELLILDFEDFLGGGSFSQVLQKVIPGVGRDVFLAYKPLILEKLQDRLLICINEKLQQPDVRKFIDDIFGQ